MVAAPGHARLLTKSLVGGAALGFLLFRGAGTLVAQEPALPRELLLFREVPTVITAAGRPQPLTQAPAAVTVITAEQIRQSGATNIPDVLRIVPGLDVARTTATDVNIAARGLNTFGVTEFQLLIDGRPVSEEFVGSVRWHQLPVSLEEIERIEVVKSPASALYGDRAFGGVVHIITKSPEALKGTSVAVTLGDFGTALTSLIHADVVGRLRYKFSLGYDRTNQFPNPDAGISDDDTGRENLTGNVLVSYRLAERSEISLSGGINAFRKIDFIESAEGVRSVGDGEFWFLRAQYTLGNFATQYVFNRFDATTERLGITQSTLADAHQLDLRQSVELGTQNILLGGVSYRFNAFESPVLAGREREQHLFAVFVQDEHTFFDSLTATAGIRLDTHPEAGTTFSPRASLVYTPWLNHTFRASAGTAFRNPTIFDNFSAAEVPAGPVTVTVTGNRDLEPMKLVAYELGYQTYLFERLRGRLDLFYNQLTQSIETRQASASDPTRLTLVNTKGFATIGAEPALEVLISKELTAFANYSYQDRTVTDPDVPGIVPRHKANAGVTLALPGGFSATVIGHYVGEATGAQGRVDPYTQFNLRVAQKVKLWGQEAELSLQGFNVFNEVHRELPSGDLIGRRISGTFRVRF